MQCKDCKFNCYKCCVLKVLRDCFGEVIFNGEFFSLGIDIDILMDIDNNDINSDSSWGLDDIEELFFLEDKMFFLDLFDFDVERDEEVIKIISLLISNNILLMRVVQFIKYIKRKSSIMVKEGWMVYYISRDNLRKRYYWRFDSKCLILFQNEFGLKYYKEILFLEIFCIFLL